MKNITFHINNSAYTIDIGHDLDGWDYEVIEAWEDQEIEVIGSDNETMLTKVPSWVAFKGFVNSKNK